MQVLYAIIPRCRRRPQRWGARGNSSRCTWRSRRRPGRCRRCRAASSGHWWRSLNHITKPNTQSGRWYHSACPCRLARIHVAAAPPGFHTASAPKSGGSCATCLPYDIRSQENVAHGLSNVHPVAHIGQVARALRQLHTRGASGRLRHVTPHHRRLREGGPGDTDTATKHSWQGGTLTLRSTGKHGRGGEGRSRGRSNDKENSPEHFCYRVDTQCSLLMGKASDSDKTITSPEDHR